MLQNLQQCQFDNNGNITQCDFNSVLADTDSLSLVRLFFILYTTYLKICLTFPPIL